MLCSVIDVNVGENVTSSRYRKCITPVTSKTFDTFGDFTAKNRFQTDIKMFVAVFIARGAKVL